jgi:Fe-S cluster biosynthesis and repair protein YggX
MKTCAKCGRNFDENLVDDTQAAKYPSCNSCWKEWTDYAVMVINEMRLDMSLPEHRRTLKRYERVFFGLEKGEEITKKPDSR